MSSYSVHKLISIRKGFLCPFFQLERSSFFPEDLCNHRTRKIYILPASSNQETQCVSISLVCLNKGVPRANRCGKTELADRCYSCQGTTLLVKGGLCLPLLAHMGGIVNKSLVHVHGPTLGVDQPNPSILS